MMRVMLLLKTNEGGMWILPQIAELRRRGFIVTAVLPSGKGRLRCALDDAGVPVEDSPFEFSFRPSIGSLQGLLKLRHLIRKIKPDILFYHLYASALAARLSSLGLSVHRVHMVAGPLYLDSPGIRLVERVMSRLDHQIIAGSAHTASRYRELDVPSHRLSTIPYGVDLVRFGRGEDCREKLFGCGPNTFVAIMVAYVYPPKTSVYPGIGIKGHDVLLNAWAQICTKFSDVLLVLVGGGFGADGEIHRQWLMTKFALPLDPRVIWLDSVDDVRPMYSSADLSVSPSLSENHGAALEASAMSVPSIVSDAGGLPETVTPNSGWVVRAGDQMALENAIVCAINLYLTGELATMGLAARTHAENNFSSDICTRKVADIIEAV